MVLFKLLVKAESFTYIDKELYGYRVNDNSVTRRLVLSVRPDALIALNHIIDYAKENKYVISLKDIAIARSDIRRNMMKEAILNKNKEFFINTDNVLKKYIDNGSVKYIEKQIDIERFQFDDLIYNDIVFQNFLIISEK